MSGWQAGRPSVLAVIQQLQAVGPEKDRTDDIVASLPFEHALLLVPEADRLGEVAPAAKTLTTLIVSIASDGFPGLRLDGRELVRSARHAGVELPPKRAKDLADRVFTAYFGPERHPLNAASPPADVTADSPAAAELGECGRSG